MLSILQIFPLELADTTRRAVGAFQSFKGGKEVKTIEDPSAVGEFRLDGKSSELPAQND